MLYVFPYVLERLVVLWTHSTQRKRFFSSVQKNSFLFIRNICCSSTGCQYMCQRTVQYCTYRTASNRIPLYTASQNFAFVRTSNLQIQKISETNHAENSTQRGKITGFRSFLFFFGKTCVEHSNQCHDKEKQFDKQVFLLPILVQI